MIRMPQLGEEHWINPPPAFTQTGGVLAVTTGRETDYWNNTFYGFKHDNGHFRATPVTGDFSLTVTFSAAYSALYDQAGAMLRADGDNWLKCGVEFTDGRKNFSVVVTRDDQSDWSVMPIGGAIADPVTLRLTRHGDALRVEVETEGGFRLVRLAFLRMAGTIEAGPMCCSPVGTSLHVSFQRVEFGAPIPRALHD
jgi:regulation of enolase protein 1 (concanavalin A-like superfamily)